MKKALTQKELAERWGVTERTVYNWRKTGRVDAVKVANTVRITAVRVIRDSDKTAA
jgi:excisionase family DNA binding protein